METVFFTLEQFQTQSTANWKTIGQVHDMRRTIMMVTTETTTMRMAIPDCQYNDVDGRDDAD